MGYSSYLCIPAALKFRIEICGGEQKIMEYSSALVFHGAKRVAEILGTKVLNNEECTMTCVLGLYGKCTTALKAR